MEIYLIDGSLQESYVLEYRRDYTLSEIIWYLGLNLNIFKKDMRDDARFKHIIDSFALFL